MGAARTEASAASSDLAPLANAAVLRATVIFSLCSATLLIINKAAIRAFHAPSLIASAQFLTATIFVYALKWSGHAEVDVFEWGKVRLYLVYVGMFVGSIYSNMKALELANVETLIVFRCCTPLVVSLLDWAFLNREFPSARSGAMLLMMLFGAAGYVASDKEFQLHGWSAYGWVGAYFFIISVEMAYGKTLVSEKLKLKSMWSPTLYTNALSLPPMLAAGILTGEVAELRNSVWSVHAVSMLLLSCIIGVAISYSGWQCRRLVTATCYTVIGVTNKMATVLVNVLIWDQHASFTGICALFVCLCGAAFYQQSPLRSATKGDTSQEPFSCIVVVALRQMWAEHRAMLLLCAAVVALSIYALPKVAISASFAGVVAASPSSLVEGAARARLAESMTQVSPWAGMNRGQMQWQQNFPPHLRGR